MASAPTPSPTPEEGPLDITDTNSGDSNIVFYPPLYRQRYHAVLDVVKEYQPKRVVDFGCAECKLIYLLKHTQSLEKLVGIDLDRDLLKRNAYITQPLLGECIHRRTKPFTISLYCGSVGEADDRLVGFDMVTCVELIEHLEDDMLEKLHVNIFGHIHPRVVAVTTPNAEFNVLFTNFTGRRNPDHKFEWTRKEFEEWCSNVAELYGYTVVFSGIGDPPEGKRRLGHCSQMAVFTLNDENTDNSIEPADTTDTPPPPTTKPAETEEENVQNGRFVYELIAESHFPFKQTTQADDILNEALYYIPLQASAILNRLCNDYYSAESPVDGDQEVTDSGYEWEGPESVDVPLDDLIDCQGMKKLKISKQKLREVLQTCGDITLNTDDTAVIYTCPRADSDSWYDSDSSLNNIEDGEKTPQATTTSPADQPSVTTTDCVSGVQVNIDSSECWD